MGTGWSSVVVSAAVVATLVLAACGGGEEQSSGPARATATIIPGVAASPVAAAWEEVRWGGAGPEARRDATLVHDGEGKRLLLFGGRAGGRGLNDLWSFSEGSGQWARIETPDAPPVRWGHVAVFDGKRGELVVFSGQSAAGFFNDVWTWSAATGRWSETQAAGVEPATRYGSCAGYDAGRDVLYISHGFTNSGRFDDTWAFDLSKRAWTDVSASGARPVKRCLHHCGVDPQSGGLLLFGGQSNETPILGDLWRFNPERRAWAELTPGSERPSPRFFSSFDVAGGAGQAIVFGGATGQGAVSDTWRYSIGGGWSQESSAGGGPSSRSSHAAVMVDDGRALYVFGGAGASETGDMWRLRLR